MSTIIAFVLIIIILISFFLYLKKEGLVPEGILKFNKFIYSNGGIPSKIHKYCKDTYQITLPKSFRKVKNIQTYKLRDKVFTHTLLEKNNIPVPKHYKWDYNLSKDENISNVYSKLNFPVVIKPTHGTQGKDVFMNITQDKLQTFDFKKLYNQTIIIEEQISGLKYRIFIIDNNVFAIHLCTPPVLVGDGKSDIEGLINKYNSQRQYNQIIYQSDIQEHSYQDILPNNKKILANLACNLSNGAILEDIPINTVHPINLDLFKRVSQILEISPIGIDYIGPHLSIPYHRGGVILEINGKPGFNGIINYNMDKLCQLYS